MKRGFLIALIAAGVGATVAVTTGTLLEGDARAAESALVNGPRHAQSRGVAVPQPDTSSRNWKKLSDDVGVMIRKDERLGLRGRLYVSVDGAWLPVATDGLADVLPLVPLN